MEDKKDAVAVPATAERELTLNFTGEQTVEIRLADGDNHIIEGVIQIELDEEGRLTLYRRLNGELRNWAGYPDGCFSWYRTVN
jgi:pyruvate carboxylase